MENNNELSKKELVKEYEKNRKKHLICAVLITLICIGATIIVSAFLFRTQYPLTLKNEGQQDFSYDHILMCDVQHFSALNKFKGNEIHYYIVYKSGNLYYELETDFLTYSQHAKKENVSSGITNHSAIKENITKYTFSEKDGKSHCYDEKTSKIKALFDVANVTGKFIWRLIAYIGGAGIIIVASVILKRYLKKSKVENI